MNISLICVNFFECVTCEVKWIARWYHSCADCCPYCGQYVNNYHYEILGLKETHNKTVSRPDGLIINNIFLIPYGKSKDKILRNNKRGNII